MSNVSGKRAKTPLDNGFRSGLERPVCRKVGGVDLFGCQGTDYPKRKYGVRLAEVRISNFEVSEFFETR